MKKLFLILNIIVFVLAAIALFGCDIYFGGDKPTDNYGDSPAAERMRKFDAQLRSIEFELQDTVRYPFTPMDPGDVEYINEVLADTAHGSYERYVLLYVDLGMIEIIENKRHPDHIHWIAYKLIYWGSAHSEDSLVDFSARDALKNVPSHPYNDPRSIPYLLAHSPGAVGNPKTTLLPGSPIVDR